MSSSVEAKINKKITHEVNNFKEELKTVILSFENDSDKRMILETLNNLKFSGITSDDLKKRKRVKNVVPYFDRCLGKKSDGSQCTRRRKEGKELCGTHSKGIPYGKVNDNVETVKKITVFAKEIRGIVYYIDEEGNVYDTEDVYQNKNNPKIIAKYSIVKKKDENEEEYEEYSIIKK